MMQRIMLGELMAWVVMAALACLSPAAVAVDRLKLATELWPPYQTLNRDRLGGVVVERVQCALRRMGQPYEIHMMRWEKAQLLVETNQMHGFFCGAKTASRSRYAVPSEPVISVKVSWFFAPGVQLDLQDESAKYQARYGAKFNSSKWIYLKENQYNVVKKPRDVDALLQMLWRGDVDIALVYEGVFEHAMKAKGIPDDFFRRTTFRQEDQSVHFSREFLDKHPNFLGMFNEALARCIEG